MERIWNGIKYVLTSDRFWQMAVAVTTIMLREEKETKNGPRQRNEIKDNFEHLVLENQEFGQYNRNERKQEQENEAILNSVVAAHANDESKQCKICMDNERNIVIVDCKHFLVCNVCARQLSICPTCRTPITRFMVVIDS